MQNLQMAQCFAALGFHEMPQSREAVEAAYEERKKSARSDTESGKLKARLLEEHYRACLKLLDADA